MYIDKLIKREVLTLLVSVSVLLVLILGISYAFFFSVDESSKNTINIGNLEVTFCNDSSCNKNYENFGQVIGTEVIDGVTHPLQVYPYNTAYDALQTQPYIFNIKNTGSLDTNLTIMLNEDIDYILPENYNDFKSIIELYSNHLKIGISDCTTSIDKDNASIMTYGELVNNIILKDDILKSKEDKTYCLWTWLDDSTPNSAQNTYFVANLDFKAEYKPEK